MSKKDNITPPSKREQRLAKQSYAALSQTLEELHVSEPEIIIGEADKKIKVPVHALEILAEILKSTSQGKSPKVVHLSTEMTTQAAAEYLGCSRPYLVKLLEEGEIPFIKIGKHRRVKFEDLHVYKEKLKLEQYNLISKIMQADEESGLYDS